MKIWSTAALILASFVLVACGGGGATTSTGPTVNPFTNLAGTYKYGCVIDAPASLPFFPGKSLKATLTVTAVVGQQSANTAAQLQEFDGTTCNAASATFDITARGDASMLTQTKTYAATAFSAGGTAQVAQFTYSGLTFSKGTLADLGLTSLPMAGANTKVAFFLQSNVLNFAAGSRGTDGLGLYISSRQLTKQ
jgi:hypothetical protein